MTFHEVRFPANLSFGSLGGPERRTEIVTLANGYEERRTPWADSRRRYDAGLGMRSLEDVELLIAFFEARRGQLHGFRWKDWADYKSCAAGAEPGPGDQSIAFADGTGRRFQLVKRYASGGAEYLRPVVKPVAGSVTLAVAGDPLREGAGFALDSTTGEVVLDAVPPAGAEITAGYEFDVPVRFDTDRVQVSVASFKAGDVPSVPVVEIRL